MTEREPLSKRARFEVLKRDCFTCQYCGAHPPSVILHVDHINPVANGGGSEIDNLVTACEGCNQGKGARLLTSVPEPLEVKAKRIAEAEEQLQGYQDIMRAKFERLDDEMWQVAEVLWPGSGKHGAHREELLSIRKFIQQLGLYPCLELAEISFSAASNDNRRFLYFCGCCWKRIRGEQ